MRIGQNPAKFVDHVVKPARITLAILNYIPFLSGFYEEMHDVLKHCLASARNEPGMDMDVMVFDNGSCDDVRDWLVQEKEAGRIQYLILSEKNLGKGGAWNMIFGGAPGEIIAYADNDVLFSPGWLSRSVQVLETYPNVGMVTSRPLRTPMEFSRGTLEWAQSKPEYRYREGNFQSWDEYSSFVLSLGTDPEDVKNWYETELDRRVEYQGIPAQIGASHWQFVAYKSTLQAFLPFDMDRPMGQVRALDRRINEAGLLRLMTVEHLAQNMSNTLPEELRSSAPPAQTASPLGRRILNLPPVKKLLLGFYNRVFRIYYRSG